MDFVDQNDYLRSLLYGNQGVFDGPAVQADFALFSSLQIKIVDPTISKVNTEKSSIDFRAAVLLTALGGALVVEIQQEQTPKSLFQIDITLADLEAFRGLKDAGSLPACNYVLSASTGVIDGLGGAVNLSIDATEGCPIVPSRDQRLG